MVSFSTRLGAVSLFPVLQWGSTGQLRSTSHQGMNFSIYYASQKKEVTWELECSPCCHTVTRICQVLPFHSWIFSWANSIPALLFFKNARSSYKILLLLNKSGPYKVLLSPRCCSGEKFGEWPSLARPLWDVERSPFSKSGGCVADFFSISHPWSWSSEERPWFH